MDREYKKINIAIDFDGTCVTHEFPNIGKDIGAVPVLKKMVEYGFGLILNTMRSGVELLDAIKWFEDNDIKLHSIYHDPTQYKWTKSPKCYAHLYIDDANLFAPLKKTDLSERPYIDWVIIDNYFIENYNY